MKVQRLYLAKGMGQTDIAAELGIPNQQVANIVYRHGLAELRRRNEARALAKAGDRAVADAEDFVASVVMQSQELAERGFHLAREAGDGKEFAMAAKGTQVFVGMARQGMGLDASGSAQAARGAALTLVYADFREASEPQPSAEPVEVRADDVSDDVILDFEQSQQAESRASKSAELIAERAQPVDSGVEESRRLNKPVHNPSYVNHDA